MGRPSGRSRKGRPPKVQTGCLTCKERGLKCDETLPTCQRCQHSERVCKGLWGKTGLWGRTSTSPQTLAPSNTSPAANTRARVANTQCSRSSAEAEPPISSSDFENQQQKEPTGVESIANAGQEHIHMELEARGRQQDFINEPEGMKEKNIQSQEGQSGGQEGDHGSPMFVQTASQDDLADGANRSQQSSIIANRDGSENARTRKRSVEARTTGNSKRTRRRKDEQQHSGSTGNDIQTTKEDEHPDNENSSAMQKARLALSAVDAKSVNVAAVSRWTKQAPPTSRNESNGASTHSPISDSRPLGIAENGNARLSGQPRHPPNDPQHPHPSISSSHDSQGPSTLHVLSSGGQVSSPVPVETERDLGRSWSSNRVDNPLSSISTVEIERRPSMSGSFGTPSTAETRRLASVDNLAPSTDSTHCPETFSNELRTTSRSFDPRSLQSMSRRTSPTGFSQPSLHAANQAILMQDARSQLLQPQRNTTTDPTRGNHSSDSVSACQQLESVDDPTGSRTVSTSSSNVTIPAPNERDPRQAPPLSQASYQPTLAFTDNHIQGALSTAMQPYVAKFSSNGYILLRPKKTPTEDKVYPMGVLMWLGSPDFHAWYMAETGTTDVSILRFELFDAESKLEKMFFISRGDAHNFQMLRQYIWDFFWVASNLGNAPTFKVVIRAVHQLPNHAFPPDPVGAECRAFRDRYVDITTTSRTGNIGAVAHSRTPAIMRSRVHDRYRPYHNEVAAHNITSTASPAPTPKYAAIAPKPEDAPRDVSSRQTAIAALPAPEISVRLQTDRRGKVSVRYSKWVLKPEVTTTEFFAWFAQETGRGGREGPPLLRFTLKDSMPVQLSLMVAQADENCFDLFKRDVKTQLEKAREFMPGLKEFLVLVTDPYWV